VKVVAYIRSESAEETASFEDSVRTMWHNKGAEIKFYHEGLSGSRWLRRVLAEKADAIVVHRLADLGRDMHGLLSLLAEHDADIFVVSTRFIQSGAERKVFARELMDAERRYTDIKRKVGMAAAKAMGASMGRPAIFTLSKGREAIQSFLNASEGRLPSARKLAERLGCGKTRASQLLAEFREQTGKETP